MVWGEARAAEQCVDTGAPEITGKAQALLSGRAANDARQLAYQRQSPDLLLGLLLGLLFRLLKQNYKRGSLPIALLWIPVLDWLD